MGGSWRQEFPKLGKKGGKLSKHWKRLVEYVVSRSCNCGDKRGNDEIPNDTEGFFDG
jgi:hypothetical protein